MKRTLLSPFLLSNRNRFFPAGRFPTRTTSLLLFAITLCLGCYFLTVKVVHYFHSQNELGIILSLKIFQMAWIVMFAMLVFSAMVSAVSTLFLSQDNEIILSAPVPPQELYFMRYLTTTVYTSWMMVIFSIPVFGAYGQVFNAGPLYWPLMLCTVVATAFTGTGIAMAITIVLVNLFPARRTKDIIIYLSLCFGLLIYLMFRMLRPEELVNPEKYGHFVEYLSAISTPAGPLVPAAWSANLLSTYLLDREVDWLLLGLIIWTVPTLYLAGQWAMKRFFFSGFNKSQESFGGHIRFGVSRYYKRGIWRWIWIKETKIFLRDSTEWSQLFMIGALVVVYLYNFKVLPVDRSPIQEEYVANVVSFLNIGLVGFMVTSLSARFVYPAVGSEGGAFAMILSAPLAVRSYLLSKCVFYAVPFTVFSLFLVIVSDHLLHITGPMWWFSIGISLLATWTVVSLAISFGALYTDFKEENKAAALGGMGAILYLFTSMTVLFVVIFSGALPIYRIMKQWLRGLPISPENIAWTAAWAFFALLLTVSTCVIFFRKAVKRLEV
ncbi:MAG: hypothetical protein H8E41_06970 [Desulfobulbaceae bacterium]|uniref:Uncharacterized protein n=1 Tax=Candidatus Desulfobia pelagia TaxID=2841692 RepID=A0A8J6TFL9_9BACT|nr:hypothetical protein [Candidatus Desulfobia pelagia]